VALPPNTAAPPGVAQILSVSRGHRIALITDARSSGPKSPVFAGREQHGKP